MPKKRTLHDLYAVGKEVTFDDGEGDPVKVWVQKVNKVDRASIFRHADAARAVAMAKLLDQTSDEFLAAKNLVIGLDRKTLVDSVLRKTEAESRETIEAELEADEEWSKDGYLQGLRDAWLAGTGGSLDGSTEDTDAPAEGDGRPLRDIWLEDNDHPEAARVFAELKRFAELVDERVEMEMLAYRAAHDNTPEEELQRQAVVSTLEATGNQAWLDEFYRAQIFYSTRSLDNHRQRHFGNRDEVSSLPDEVFDALHEAIESLTVEPRQGKGSEGTPTSSESPEQPAAAGAGVSSGPEVSPL